MHAASLRGSGKRREKLEKTKEKERRLCLLLHPTRLCLMLPPSFSLHESGCSQRAVSGSQQNGGGGVLNQCFHQLLNAGLSFDAVTMGENLSSPLHSTHTPFIFFSPLLSFHLAFPPFSLSLLTAVIVSFSLSKNIVFLP